MRGEEVVRRSAAVLSDVAPELARIVSGAAEGRVAYPASEIRVETVRMTTRDGIALATDLYRPPMDRSPAIAIRTPHGRRTLKAVFIALARSGYAVVAQDCRGTGESEPDYWDFYIYEADDSVDFVAWAVEQDWHSGFLGSLGGSYVGGTQWCMAMHPSMTAIAPEVAGLGVARRRRVRSHTFVHAHSKSVGRGADKVPIDRFEMERQMVDDTLASGYFNEPLFVPLPAKLIQRYPELKTFESAEGREWLWRRYCSSTSDDRSAMVKLALGVDAVTFGDVEALDRVFPHHIHPDLHLLPSTSAKQLVQSVRAPALVITGWYDSCLDDALRTWELLASCASKEVRDHSRLLITPSAHNAPGYHEGGDDHPELNRIYRAYPALLSHRYDAVRDNAVDGFPKVTYYLMGANQWCPTTEWPPKRTSMRNLYLGSNSECSSATPSGGAEPDSYVYDPEDPTPTLGGSIVSGVYIPGSVNVSDLYARADLVTFTTSPLDSDLDVIGPVRLVLFASSTAVDTDFVGCLSDVFPDCRVIQIQSGIIRARYRDPKGGPEFLEPGRVYRFEIDMTAMANRFRIGHSVRLDVSSADFPKLERNTNRGGEAGPPIRATQMVFHDADHPSCLELSVLGPPR